MVQGNLIGTDGSGKNNYGNAQGVLLNNAPFNTIGGVDPLARNVISRNQQTGVEIIGTGSTGELIANNNIGPDILGDGDGFRTPNTDQQFGVFISGSAGNLVFMNTLSSNGVGVVITGNTATGNNIAYNKIGTTTNGMAPDSNYYVGVFLNNTPSNVIQNNVISANGNPSNASLGFGDAGIDILGQISTKNVIISNLIGPDATGAPAFNHPNQIQKGQALPPDSQANGVVIIGSSSNQVTGNRITGNIQTGVYITRRDFVGVTYQSPINNSVTNNVISFNDIYGVLRYDAPQNPVPQSGAQRNTFSGNQQNLRDYLSQFDKKTNLPATKPKLSGSASRKTKIASASVSATVSALPKVPHLFKPGTTPHPVQTTRRSSK